jgi:hypothetical protein
MQIMKPTRNIHDFPILIAILILLAAILTYPNSIGAGALLAMWSCSCLFQNMPAD